MLLKLETLIIRKKKENVRRNQPSLQELEDLFRYDDINPLKNIKKPVTF